MDKGIDASFVWKTKKCAICRTNVRVQLQKPIKKEDWEEPAYCSEHDPRI